ncbi:MAG TPA: alpha/beta fold hydrolase [Dehalococcoidia bacterium]|nr:alpha/beta fold hydrolase [Dehalococcoidia bacterium]
MDQKIGFCTTSDGVRIAYAVAGEGPPLVCATGWPVHLDLEWQKPFARRFLEDLGRGFTLIRYDMRGSGLSDRGVSGFSIESLILDLEAVIHHFAPERFALLSLGDLAGPLAIMYTASHPERVSRLVLNSPFLRGRDLAPPERQKAMIEFVATYGFPTFEFVDAPGVDVTALRDVRELAAAAAPYAVQAEVLKTMYSVDLSAVADGVTVPTLVLHARGDTFVPFELGREVATRIPGAEFVPFEGASNAPWVHRQVIVQETQRFLASATGTVQATGETAGSRPYPDRLTRREVEILRLVAAGRTSREIAETLVLSVRTVERHIANIYTKIGARTRAQATAYALSRGLA